MGPTVDVGGRDDLLEGIHEVRLSTSQGDIDLRLDADKAPLAVTNFVLHTRNGYYTDMVFHRVIDDFMIQGGDPTATGTGGTSVFGESFADEQNDIGMDRGVIAMANSGPNTNGSQFFIVQRTGGVPRLAGKHTAFGTVTAGMDVVDTIAATPTDANDRPVTEQHFTASLLTPTP